MVAGDGTAPSRQTAYEAVLWASSTRIKHFGASDRIRTGVCCMASSDPAAERHPLSDTNLLLSIDLVWLAGRSNSLDTLPANPETGREPRTRTGNLLLPGQAG